MLDTLSSLIPSQADLLWNLATSAAGYVLMSLALLRLSRALSLPHPAFAWIPFLNYYRLGQIADLYTDNRMTDDEERAAPFYKPSDLRRKTLGYSIAIAATSAAASIAAVFILAKSFYAFLSAFFGQADEISDLSQSTLITASLIAFAAGMFCLIFAILFLTAYCPALCRIFTALEAPVPALFTAISVFVPLAGMILLYIFTQKAQNIPGLFAPAPSPTTSPIESDTTP